MPCLEVETAAPEASPLVDAKILDGTAVVQMLNPGTAKTFLDYAEQFFFTQYVSAQLENTTGVDIVWDVYQTDSLKGTNETKEGQRCTEKSCSLGSDSKELEGFLACGRQQDRTV